ncbi:MAG: hypothetical protein LC627_00555 [Verrucomicrobiaceae bacterium]|nr:hypothetical protein [Verrucomicrobiaceae bacterium]
MPLIALTLLEWAAFAQVVATVVVLFGIIISLWMSVKALREVQLDRKLRQRPHLAFETGGWAFPVHFVVAGRRVPGVNPAYAEEVLVQIPPNAESVRIVESSDPKTPPYFGRLKNYGTGPALLTHVTWIAKEVWIGAEKFTVDSQKAAEPLYAAPLNYMPTIPSHIAPDAEASLSRLPAFIEKDYERKIRQVDGVLHIECEDVFREQISLKQQFHLFTRYTNNPPEIHVTFSDLVDERDEEV